HFRLLVLDMLAASMASATLDPSGRRLKASVAMSSIARDYSGGGVLCTERASRSIRPRAHSFNGAIAFWRHQSGSLQSMVWQGTGAPSERRMGAVAPA